MGPPTVDFNAVLAVLKEVSDDAVGLAPTGQHDAWVQACEEARSRLEAALVEGRL